jgi:predicted DNA-binding transcriptional regulator YafY
MTYAVAVSNAHRIVWIDAQIRAGRRPNTRAIAERFEISTRQAARDVEYLRYSMGAPIEYDARRGGFVYGDDAFALPSVFLSASERDALRHLAHQYGSAEDERAREIAALFARLSELPAAERSDGAALPVLDADARQGRLLEIVEKAIATRSKLAARYLSRDGRITARTLHPYELFSRRGSIRLAAYCELRGEVRSFRLAGFEALEETAGRFEVPDWYEPGAHDDQIPEAWSEPFVARIRFPAGFETARLRVEAKPLGDGTHTVEFWHSPALLSALLAESRAFEILAPAWLREKLAAELAALARRHRG